ncbi:MAG TPA: EI24 domain-containing protein [Kofleriaceae bacterium]|nr:EI24 domain-containing protein [Kofleriaceae bacterium]
MSDLARGMGDVGRGFRFLNAHPRLWAYVIAPALITLVLLVGAIFGVLHFADPIVAYLTDWMPGWLRGIASTLLEIVVVVGLGFGALLVFVSVVGIVAGPFNELLSEAVERAVTGRPGPGFSFAGLAKGALLGLLHGIRRLIVAVLGMIVLFALGFVPVIGTIAALVLGVWFTARAAAYDCYDAVLARQELSYAAKLDYLRANRSRTFGLGLAVAGLLFVPVVNLVALGLGAAGATLAALPETTPSTRATGRRPRRA